ncbi:MAG: hypothetical protein AABW79_03360 [Nanoarchaeota archaeon]
MKPPKRIVTRVIILLVILILAITLSIYIKFSNKQVQEIIPEEVSNSKIESCELDSDCGIFTTCQQFSSSESALYAPCSYFATTTPRCINQECIYKDKNSIITRCLPSCLSDEIIPKECSTPRDSSGQQNSNAECISHPESTLACQSPKSCNNVYSGNCRGITAVCA